MCRSLFSLIIAGVVLGLFVSGAGAAELIGYWPLDGNADDQSGHGYDGLIEGDVSFVDAVLGQGSDHNGSNALINCGDVPLGDALSVAFWVKPRNISQDWAGYVSKWTLDNSQRTFWLGQHSTDGWMRFGIYPGGATAETPVDSGQVILANEVWTHIACTHDGNIQRIYADGVEIVASPPRNAGVIDRGGNLRFGIVSTANWFNGTLDDIQIYNGALTEAEVQAAMQGIASEQASGPNPADGATDVLRDRMLSWTAGEFAATHNVYLGKAFADVNNAGEDDPLGTLVSLAQDANTYDPGTLDFGDTYYWRVDEVNGAPDRTVFKGKVWSFTAEPYSIPIEAVTASASSQNAANMGPERTIDGSGLNALDQHSTEGTEMWLSATGDPDIWIQYAFDRVYKLHEMWVWNSNQVIENFVGLGVKEVTVEVSTDGENWTTIPDVPVVAQAIGALGYAHNTTIDLGGALARYVKISVNSGYGPLGQYGLSEVRFFYVPTFPREPEPADSSVTEAVDVDLKWRAGREAAVHEVYLGTSEADQAQWKIDFQGDANHNGIYGQTDPVDMVEDGAVWNIFEVASLDKASPGPSSFTAGPISLDLLDVQGTATGAQFTVETNAWGWAGNAGQEAQPMAGDYLIILNAFEVVSEPGIWTITGLAPEADYELTFHHAANGPAARGCNFTANGVEARVTGVADTATITVTTDGAGTISGTVNSDGFDEGNWSGLVITGAPVPNLALIDTVNEPGHTVTDLNYDQTYFWQIVEVNDAEDPAAYPGPVWRFTTPAYAVVDDFESYDDDCRRIFFAWEDGLGHNGGLDIEDCDVAPSDGNGGGSIVGNESSPFAERTIVHSGTQSMPLAYDNNYGPSETTLTLDAEDWTTSGIKSLSLFFRGTAGNTGQLYLKINNTKVSYTGDAADIAATVWTPWIIDLSTTGANLQNVTSLSLGVDGAAASGMLYIDDIRLYPLTPETLTPVDPGDANLVAYYPLDGNLNDASGNGAHGTDNGDLFYEAGVEGQALRLDGVDDFADLGVPTHWPSGAAPRTLCAWAQTFSLDPGWRIMVGYGSPAGGQATALVMNGTVLNASGYGSDISIDNFWEVQEWHHVALTYDGSMVRLYADGVEVTSGARAWNTNITVARIGRQVNEASEFFEGLVDEVRLYDRVLSLEELAWLAGKTEPVVKPF